MYDVVIIGAGITGAMTARTLARYDLRLCILEKENDVALGATKANSAIVHAGFDAQEGSLKALLNVRGSQMMEQTAKELGVKYLQNGSLVIGFTSEDRVGITELLERGRKNGVPQLRIVEQAELRELEPNIGEQAVCALYAPTGAIVCPYELAIAAVGNAMDNGVELKRGFQVTGIAPVEGGWEVTSGAETVRTRFVVNAAGLYADKIAEMAGCGGFEIHPRRGEYILLDKECGGLARHTVFRTPTKMGKGILVTPTVDGNLLLGPTSVDGTDKEDKATTQEGLELVMRETKRSLQGLPLNKAITSFCGLRAAGSTGDFIINSPKQGFINAAGIESPGLSASPAIGAYIAELLEDQKLPLREKSRYNPCRKPAYGFREASIEEKNRIIQRNSAYGRIICRCETVTEGEVVEAIRTNPGAVDLDGIKRRTRAQMGRCQGGFCMPYLIEILSRELGIPYEDITKNGAGSPINVGRTKEEI